MEKLIIDEGLYLSPPTDSDAELFVRCLNDEEVARSNMRIPHPFTKNDAQAFLDLCRATRRQCGRNAHWLIRRANGEAIGGIGFYLNYGAESHRDELGYWMARSYRGNGLMTKVIKRFCEYGFSYLGLIRIEAIVIDENKPSERVLEKNGFKYEGLMKKMYEKKGKYFDGRMYALVK